MPVRRLVVALVAVLSGDLCASISCAQDTPAPPGSVIIINGRPVREAREIATTPAARAALRDRMRSTMPMRYPDVARVVGLAPEEVARLFDLLADQQLDAPQLMLLPTQELERLSDPARAAFDRQHAKDAEVARLLGARYEAWLKYSQSLQARMQVAQLRSILITAGQPIDDATADSLVEAFDVEMRFNRLKNAVARTTPSGQVTAQLLADNTTERNRQLLEVAARWLTPGQLAEYSIRLVAPLPPLRAAPDVMPVPLDMRELPVAPISRELPTR